MSILPTSVSLEDHDATVDALRSWLSPETSEVEFNGRALSVSELLEDPRSALNIAAHESDSLWRTTARIEFHSPTSATLIVTTKGGGLGTDRLRFTLSQGASPAS